jgi:hypothetical protein
MEGKMLVWVCPNCDFKVPMKENEFPIRCTCGFFGVIQEATYIDKKDWGKAPPMIPKLGVNFIKAVANNVKHGVKFVSELIYKQRLETCNTCEYVMHRKVRQPDGSYQLVVHRCSHKSCGCFLKQKAWLKREHCPMGYWKDKDDQE